MKNKIKRIIKTKQFHIGILSLIIFIIIFSVGVISLKYQVEGENNPPFKLSKISIISSTEGIDNVEDTTNKWNLKVNQNNDIYLYIKKNENYTSTEIIDKILIENFKIEENPKIGEFKIFQPDNTLQNTIFSNKVENEVKSLEYLGSIETNISNMEISNQGGIIVFRNALNNVGNYISNEDEEVNHTELLKKLSINNDDIKFEVSFDIFINLNSKKTYKAKINLELPINDIVNEGIQSVEYTDLENIKLKRTNK